MEYSIRSSMCRLCLCCEDPFASIFEKNASDQYDIALILRELLQFQVFKNDGYPEVICYSCLKTVTDFKTFKEACTKSKITYDTKIRLLENGNMQLKLQDVEIGNEECRSSLVNEGCNADNLDVFGNLLPKEEQCLSEDEENCLRSDVVDGDEIKATSGFSEIEEHHVKIEPIYDYRDSTIGDPDRIAEDRSFLQETFPIEGGPVITSTVSERVEGNTLQENFASAPVNENCSNIKSECDVSNNMYGRVIITESLEYGETSFQNTAVREQGESLCKAEIRTKLQSSGDLKKKHICDICGKECCSKRSITFHVRIHSGAKPHKCKVCPKSFSYPHILRNHEKLHFKLRNYSCNECSKTYITLSALKTHQKTHEKECSYLCHECKKGFKYKQSYKNHILIHSGLRPFKCTVCGKSFNHRSNLMKHYAIHAKANALKGT